ncbi:MAG: hypothetical protein HY547_01615 [Elusimicrobia bacterium]|nr:hypothetical protein [Elusimicrobiota bacterium]
MFLSIFRQAASGAVLDLALEIIQTTPSLALESKLLEIVPVVVSDDLMDHEVARYEWGKVLISDDRLSREARDSRGDEASAAAHLASSVAHELRHALNQQLLPRITNSIEEETSAFASEMAAYAEIKNNNPQAFEGKQTSLTKYSRGLWKVWRRQGPDGLRSWVKERYFISSVQDDFYWDARRQERVYLTGALDRLPLNILSYDEADHACDASNSRRDCLRSKGFPPTLEDWIKLSTHGLISTRIDAFDAIRRQELKEQMLQWDRPASREVILEFYRQEDCRAWSLWRQHFPDEKLPSNPPQYCRIFQKNPD